MEWTLLDWFSLVLRWFHVFAGMCLLGVSLYYGWLDRVIARAQRTGKAEQGEVFMGHMINVLLVERFKADPSELDRTRRWYQVETNFAWVSGVILLAMVCYLPGRALVSQEAIGRIGLFGALASTLTIFVACWWIYDRVWANFSGKFTLLQAFLSLVTFVCVTWIFAWMYTGRGAFSLVASFLATLIAGNIRFHLIPAMREMTESHGSGRVPDGQLCTRAHQRSTHNSYLAYPMIGLMVSNHVPVFYSHPLSWIALVLVAIGYLGARNKTVGGKYGKQTQYGAYLALAVTIGLLTTTGKVRSNLPSEQVSFSAARAIIHDHCLECHSTSPANPAFTAPAGDVTFDTPESIRAQARDIKLSTVTGQHMPPPASSRMSLAEREKLGQWIKDLPH